MSAREYTLSTGLKVRVEHCYVDVKSPKEDSYYRIIANEEDMRVLAAIIDGSLDALRRSRR